MIAYTGIETVSNLAEEARDPVRSIPSAIKWVAIAVFAIYFTLPLIALSALPCTRTRPATGSRSSASAPRRAASRTTRARPRGEPRPARLDALRREGLRRRPRRDDPLHRHQRGRHRRLAHHVFDVDVRQLPEVFRRLHPKLKTPWLSLLVFAGVIPVLFVLSGQVDFLGRMYAFGAMLSFTIAHASVTALRVKQRKDEIPWRAWPNVRIAGVNWPVFAILGGLGTGIAFLVVVVQDAPTRYAGFGWLALGFVFYPIYRRRLAISLVDTSRAAIVIGPGAALEYRNILVPLAPGRETLEALDVASRLATVRRARIVAVAVIELPLELPLDAVDPQAEHEANDLLDRARTIGDSYGVDVIGRLVRARRAGRAIVDEAERRQTEIIVMGSSRRRRARAGIFGGTTDFVLKHAPCRVMVVAAKEAAA